MEKSVRYIFLNNRKPALCFRGKEQAHCIINDDGIIRAVKVSLRDHDRAPCVRRGGEDYSADLFANRLRDLARSNVITRRALALLDLPPTIDDTPELPPDEPAAVAPPAETSASAECASPEPTAAPDATTGRNGSSGKQPRKRSAQAARPPEGRDLLTTAPEPAPKSRKAGKPVKIAVAASHKERGTVIAKIAAELRIAPQPLRVRLRAAGLRAPYTEDTVRKALERESKR